MTFSGTSSAAPHVVGTAALLLQYEPSLTFTDVRHILWNSAIQDKFTGSVPNPKWGYGKLYPEGAIKYLIENYKSQ
jgi:subtilisin family serine protease